MKIRYYIDEKEVTRTQWWENYRKTKLIKWLNRGSK